MDNTTNALVPTKKIQLTTQTVQVLRGGSYKKVCMVLDIQSDTDIVFRF